MCYCLWYNCTQDVAWKRSYQATGQQHLGCIIPQAVTHSLVLLKMGGIKFRNVLSWLELLTKCYCCIYLVFISFISMMYSQTSIKCLAVNSFYYIKLTLSNIGRDSHNYISQTYYGVVLADKRVPSNYLCTLHKPSLGSGSFSCSKSIKSQENSFHVWTSSICSEQAQHGKLSA